MTNQLRLFCIASSADHSEFRRTFEGCSTFDSIRYVDEVLSAIKELDKNKKNIFVIQHDTQRRNANDLIPALRAICPDGKFIVLLSDEQHFWSTLASGGNSFLIWPTTALLFAIENTIKSEYWLGPCLTKYLFQGDGLKHLRRTGSSFEIPESLPKLSAREREVVDLLVEGLTNKEIAEALNLKLGTVKVHVNHILSKLNLEHRGQAIARITKLRALT